jgi:RNA polymerase sigma factor (sigma-70 family)
LLPYFRQLFIKHVTCLSILSITTLHTDQYLIQGLINNNSAIINEVYKKYSGKMYNWIKQHGGDSEQAQDIFQESIIAIYQKASEKGLQLTCPFEAFIFAIIRNKWYAYLKNNKNKGVTNLEDIEYSLKGDPEDQAQQIMQYEQQHILLLEKLEELHEGCRNLLQLSWSGLGMEEVAAKLNVSYGYVRKKKSECMAKLIANIKSSPLFTSLSFVK